MTKGSQSSLAQLIAQIQQGSVNIDFIHSSLTFPEKLFIILERDLHDEFIQWAGNGLCFRIIDEDGFITHVIPLYFKHSKFSSFLRQLNSYGFRKIVRGEELGCYFHPKFQQHRIDFVAMVHRVMGKIELPSFEEVQRATLASSRTPSSSALSRSSSSAKQGLTKSKTSSIDLAQIVSTESIGGSSLSTDDFSPPKTREANTSSFCLRAPWNPPESEQPSAISPGSLIRAGMVDVKPQLTPRDTELEIPSFDISEDDKRLQIYSVSPDIFRDETEKAAWFVAQSPVLSPPRISSLHSSIPPFMPAYSLIPQPPPTAPPAPLQSTSNQKVLFQSYNNHYL